MSSSDGFLTKEATSFLTDFMSAVESLSVSNRVRAVSNRHYKMALASTAPN